MTTLTRKKKRTFPKYRPDITLAISFLTVILVGAFLLCLDISNAKENVNFLDALFMATTSTCVTGLTTVVPGEQFTVFGQTVILLLIQIGGLGLMTFVSVLMLFTRAKLDFKEKLLLKDALNKDNFQGVGRYIKAIVFYTLFFEMIGFLFIFSQLYQGKNIWMELFQSLFLSVSAFCNAGIDTLGSTSLLVYQSNVVINLTVSALIILGGIGFAVWFDVAHNLRLMKRLKIGIQRTFHHLRINTKIALIMTFGLVLFGTIAIFLLEYNRSLDGLNLFDKVMASFFNSVTLRTAGFYTIDYSLLHQATKLIMIVLMLIGGSPGGTAGGIKTTTFFLLVYAVISQIKGRDTLHFFKREVSLSNFIRAFVVLGMYLFVVFIAAIILCIYEDFTFIDILFEIVSAIATVGLTVGITTGLSTVSKIVIIILMFIGRVGPVTFALSLRRRTENEKGIRYPRADIIVG